MERCEQCGSKIRDGGTTSVTGRRLCGNCGDALVGATLAVATDSGVGTAIALGHTTAPGEQRGILAWIRRTVQGGPRARG